MSCPSQLCFILWHSICTTQTHRLHHNAVVIVGKVWDGEPRLRPVLVWMTGPSTACTVPVLSLLALYTFQELDVCEPSSLKVTPALDDFVHAEI